MRFLHRHNYDKHQQAHVTTGTFTNCGLKLKHFRRKAHHCSALSTTPVLGKMPWRNGIYA
jgi:hypothetical protein